MKRSIQQYMVMEPEAVCGGSEAQVLFFVRDAQSDILELYKENTKWAECIRNMPECSLEFSNKSDMEAWNAWKKAYEHLLA